MDFRDYLTVALRLVAGATEADWRSAVSRAYYAAFHVGCELLRSLKFTVPRADRAHAFVWLRLSNSSHPDVDQAGAHLNHMRGERNWADYDSRRALSQATALSLVTLADRVIHVLDAALLEPMRTQITDTMKVYERDVLHDVTWPP
jgi:uncharacterized protein (UPF0332 family)